MAGGAERGVIRRRRLALAILAAAAVLLVAGRFAAHETAERLWALTTGADGDPRFRRMALWSRAGWAALAAGWFVTHLLVFLRSVRSVQLPRRLGNLEIAEVVPRDLLVGGLVAAGLVLGILVSADSGDWWLAAALAGQEVRLGIVDQYLARDAGYYVAQLPWLLTQQRFASRLTTVAFLLLLGLYWAIGAIRIRDRQLFMSDSARRHLAAVAALAAVAVAWGASLDGPAVVAGLKGDGALRVARDRILAAAILPPIALATATAALTWAFSRTGLIALVGWGVLVAAWIALRILLPLGGTTEAADSSPPLVRAAFGLAPDHSISVPVGPGDPAQAEALDRMVASLPVWDVGALTERHPLTPDSAPRLSLTALSLTAPDPGQTPRWRGLAVPDLGLRRDRGAAPRLRPPRRGNGARSGPLLEFEATSGAVAHAEPARFWFAPSLSWFALTDSAPSGIALNHLTTRLALSWTLQSVALVATRGALLWRRAPAERLRHLAPFADFRDAQLATLGGAPAWVLDGYVTFAGFPGAPAQPWPGTDPVRYARVGFLGVVGALDGRTRIYLAPEADSVAAAWARVAGPLVRPSSELPADVAASLRYPETLLRIQATLIAQGLDSLAPTPLRPLDQNVPPRLSLAHMALLGDSQPRLWSAVPLADSTFSTIPILVAGSRRHGAPQLRLLRFEGEITAPRWPRLGSDSFAGLAHVWPLAGALYTQQSVYVLGSGGPTLGLVRATWGGRAGTGLHRQTALEALLSPAGPSGQVPDVWGRLSRAQALLRQADSLLTSGDLVGFARTFEELKRLLAPPRTPR